MGGCLHSPIYGTEVYSGPFLSGIEVAGIIVTSVPFCGLTPLPPATKPGLCVAPPIYGTEVYSGPFVPDVIAPGVVVTNYTEVLYRGIKVKPAVLNFGDLTGPPKLNSLTKKISIWNPIDSNEEAALTWQILSGNDPAIYVEQLKYDFKQTAQGFIEVTLTWRDEDVVIDAVIEFTLTQPGLTTVATVQIVGHFLPIIIDVYYCPLSGYTERLTWTTNLMSAFDGEQRIACAVSPIVEFNAEFILNNDDAERMAKQAEVETFSAFLPKWEQAKRHEQYNTKIPGGVTVEPLTPDLNRVSLTFFVLDPDTPGQYTGDRFLNLPFDTLPHIIYGNAQRIYKRELEVVGSTFGKRAWINKRSVSVAQKSFEFLLYNNQLLNEYKSFLYEIRGRSGQFWAPDRTNQIKTAEPMIENATHVKVWSSYAVSNLLPGDHLWFRYSDRNGYVAVIDQIVVDPITPGVMRVVFTENIYNPGNFTPLSISRMFLYRLATDSVEIVYKQVSAGHVMAESSFMAERVGR